MDICKKSALWLAITAAMSANAVAEQKATPEQENVVVCESIEQLGIP
ncbi:ligand-gated channel [Vibrio cholerae]|nr:ligand-gated channel [Vibrio cholerae]